MFFVPQFIFLNYLFVSLFDLADINFVMYKLIKSSNNFLYFLMFFQQFQFFRSPGNVLNSKIIFVFVNK